jgi:hypothetical protein
MDQLQKEFDDALSIAERVRMREYMKLQVLALDMKKFSVDAKGFKEEGLFTP